MQELFGSTGKIFTFTRDVARHFIPAYLLLEDDPLIVLKFLEKYFALYQVEPMRLGLNAIRKLRNIVTHNAQKPTRERNLLLSSVARCLCYLYQYASFWVLGSPIAETTLTLHALMQQHWPDVIAAPPAWPTVHTTGTLGSFKHCGEIVHGQRFTTDQSAYGLTLIRWERDAARVRCAEPTCHECRDDKLFTHGLALTTTVVFEWSGHYVLRLVAPID